MRDVTLWSVSCKRSTDVDVRLHVTWCIAVATIWHVSAHAPTGTPLMFALSVTAVYALSLAAHEFAHAFVAWRQGGRVECVVVGPVGGLTHYGEFAEARSDLAIAAAGPVANLALCFTAVLMLVAAGRNVGPVFFPFAPPAEALSTTFIGVVLQAAWINWLLFLVNMLPLAPLDGSRIVAALMRERSYEQGTAVPTARVGVITSLACVIGAWFVPNEYAWAGYLLTITGIVGLFHAHFDLRRAIEGDDVDDFGVAHSAADIDEPRPHIDRPGPLRRWWQERRDAKLRLRIQTEREEEQRADEVLARLHDCGIESLSPQDRALLQRVSARYRQRH